MKTNIKIYLTLFFLCANMLVFAQNDDGLGTEDIIISNDYQARIADAQRLRINPYLPETTVEKPQFAYDIGSRLMDLDYPPHTLRPLAMPKLKPEKYKNSYLRLGFGTQFTPLAQIVYNDKSQENVQFGAYYKHLSANGKRENQNFRDNDLGIYTQYFSKKVEIGFDANFTQNADYFYGYNEEDTSFTSKEVKQYLRTIGGTIYLKNATENAQNIDYHQSVSFENANDNFKNKEWLLGYTGQVSKTIKEVHNATVALDVAVGNFIPLNKEDVERELFQFGGNYEFNNNDWVARGGIMLAAGDVIEDQSFDFLPELYIEKQLMSNHLVAYGGWNRSLTLNTYAKFLNENPYINLQDTLTNSRVENRIAGIKGSVKNFSYHIGFNNKVITRAALYVNDSTDMKRFDVVYDDRLSIIQINTEAAYHWNSKLRTALLVDVSFYNPKTESQAWHLPVLAANLSTTYNLKKKFILRAEIYSLAGAMARNQMGDAEKIKAMVDINLGAEYLFSNYLSFFVSLNNLANQKYQRYYNYPTYGFNAMVGAQLSF